jgi:hypothetical protein
LALLALALFVVVQVPMATEFGLKNGRVTSNTETADARLLVNRNLVPSRAFGCELYVALVFQPGALQHAWLLPYNDARQDQLAEFQPSSSRYYRGLGPPPVPPLCVRYLAKSRPTT